MGCRWSGLISCCCSSSCEITRADREERKGQLDITYHPKPAEIQRREHFPHLEFVSLSHSGKEGR